MTASNPLDRVVVKDAGSTRVQSCLLSGEHFPSVGKLYPIILFRGRTQNYVKRYISDNAFLADTLPDVSA